MRQTQISSHKLLFLCKHSLCFLGLPHMCHFCANSAYRQIYLSTCHRAVEEHSDSPPRRTVCTDAFHSLLRHGGIESPGLKPLCRAAPLQHSPQCYFTLCFYTMHYSRIIKIPQSQHVSKADGAMQHSVA